MIAEIINIGTELLLGDTVNTNAAYISQGLARLGVSCYYQTVVGDNPERLKRALELSLSRSDTVVLTGGLGPTYDDLTKETVAQLLGLPLQLHQPSLDLLKKIMSHTGGKISENNKKQAYMPKGAVVFENDRGTANGLAVEKGNKIIILLPGPPRELTAMFDNKVVPYLKDKTQQTLVSSNVEIFGLGESSIEDILHEYMIDHTNPTVAPYAKEGEVHLRVTASASNEDQARALLNPVINELKGIFSENIYGVDSGSLQQALVAKLIEKSMTIATAESCTGGMISQRITQVSGSSQVFGLGVCSYANEMKMNVLGVEKETLEKHGAVSSETALEMARGVREKADAHIGISTTGIAGPTGGTPEKPVGLVYVAVSHPKGEEVKKLLLGRGYGGGREHIRHLASSNGIYLALKTLEQY